MSIFQYISRSAEQIEQNLINALPSELPEIKDYENDVLVRSFRIWAGLAEMLHYYIDNVARESNPTSARIFENLVRLARAVDIRVRSAIPFETDLTFTLSGPHIADIIIPKDSIVSTADNQLQYMTTKVATIVAGQTTVTVQAKQMTKVANQAIGTSNGLARQVFLMPSNLVDMAITLQIGSEQYTPRETFYRSDFDSLHFVPSINPESELDLIMGDGVNGKIPTANQSVVATYYTTLGSQGKANAEELTNIISNLSLPIGITAICTNTEATEGRDRESVESLRKRIMFWNRTVETGISLETYKDLAELYQGVAKAGTKYEGGNTVQVFVIPEGGGLASPTLISEVEAYMQDKIIIGTMVSVSSAGVVEVSLAIEVNLVSNAVRVNVENDIKLALAAFGSLANQEIGGRMVSGKIAQIVCNVQGVESCIINDFNIIPYPRPINHTTTLNWQVEVLSASNQENLWRVLFTATDTFQLFQNDVFVGNFNTGVEVLRPELRFTILGVYVVGESWEFYTYPYLGNRNGFYQVEESAILNIDANNVSLTMIGGL